MKHPVSNIIISSWKVMQWYACEVTVAEFHTRWNPLTIFITNTILWDTWMLHQNEIYFFQQDFVYLRTYEWTTLAIQTLKECFYRLQLFTIQIFQKQTTPTEPKLEAHLAVGNTLACQSQLESWNMSYFHSSLNCLNSSAFIEESNQNWSHSFWIKIKACH